MEIIDLDFHALKGSFIDVYSWELMVKTVDAMKMLKYFLRASFRVQSKCSFLFCSD